MGVASFVTLAGQLKWMTQHLNHGTQIMISLYFLSLVVVVFFFLRQFHLLSSIFFFYSFIYFLFIFSSFLSWFALAALFDLAVVNTFTGVVFVLVFSVPC